jgi:hypothetical protein
MRKMGFRYVVAGVLVVAGSVVSAGGPANASANVRPEAVDDSGRIFAGATADFSVLANDIDYEGDPLSISYLSVENPKAGSAAIVGSAIRFTARSGYFGRVAVTYVVTDGHPGGQSAGTLSLLVRSHAPVARADKATVPAGRTVYLNVLGNDTDPDGDNLKIASIRGFPDGWAAIVGRRIRYQAPYPYAGFDKFGYVVTDGHGRKANGKITVRVKGIVRPTKYQLERSLSHLRLPVGAVDGYLDSQALRAVCVWRDLNGRTASRRYPTTAEAISIYSQRTLPQARRGLVVGVNVSKTCQAAVWVSRTRYLRRIMPASTGVSVHETRNGTHAVYRDVPRWKESTLYAGAMMYKPLFFDGGQALHGSISDSLVKTSPASHGCVRLLHRDINALRRGGFGIGDLVRIYGRWGG